MSCYDYMHYCMLFSQGLNRYTDSVRIHQAIGLQNIAGFNSNVTDSIRTSYLAKFQK